MQIKTFHLVFWKFWQGIVLIFSLFIHKSHQVTILQLENLFQPYFSKTTSKRGNPVKSIKITECVLTFSIGYNTIWDLERP